MTIPRYTMVFGDDCGPDGKDICRMNPAVTEGGGQYVLYSDHIERIGTAEARVRVLEEALRPMMDFLRHAEWDSHSTEAHVGNLVEQARAALEEGRQP